MTTNSIREYFRNYDKIKVVDKEVEIIIKCQWEENSLDIHLKIEDNKLMYGDSSIKIFELWRIMFMEAMNHYELAMNRLHKVTMNVN